MNHTAVAMMTTLQMDSQQLARRESKYVALYAVDSPKVPRSGSGKTMQITLTVAEIHIKYDLDGQKPRTVTTLTLSGFAQMAYVDKFTVRLYDTKDTFKIGDKFTLMGR
jgi:hypothetical protein